jgi:hypothetical protein
MSAAVTDAQFSRAIIGRYSDAYLVGRAINGFGDAIKVVGIVVAVLLALPGVLFAVQAHAGVLAAFAIVIYAGCVALSSYLFGTLVAAQGQILKAALDIAVNSSPFLSNAQRAVAMSLQADDADESHPLSSGASWTRRFGQVNHPSETTCNGCGAAAT